MLCGATFGLAIDGDGTPLVVKSPDDVCCLPVVTAETHRCRARPPAWRVTDLAELPDGVDVLFNPGGPACARLPAELLTTTAAIRPNGSTTKLHPTDSAHPATTRADDEVSSG